MNKPTVVIVMDKNGVEKKAYTTGVLENETETVVYCEIDDYWRSDVDKWHNTFLPHEMR